VAGGGANYPGDGGAATNASLGGFCDGAAVDATGNLFIADATHNRIRKVDLNGVITTVAGNGAYGYSGDGGAATNASLKYPAGVAVDASGNLLIADLANNRIRKVAVSDFPTLSLDNVSAGNSGNYQVIIASPYGSVTSAVATLTVAPLTSQNPVITMSLPLISGNNLLIGFSLTQGTNSSFTLFQTLDLTLPWTTNTSAVLTTNALGGRYQFSVGAPAAVEFYQVRPP
jgi:hypothetical protein